MKQLTFLETDSTASESVENSTSYESNSKCSVPDCKNKGYMAGYCRKHALNKGVYKCIETDCKHEPYAQGYCKKHYCYYIRHGKIKPKSGKYGTHHLQGTPTYNAWANMKSRCDNAKNKMYPNYGGKGITYCKRWELFENFLNDMGEKPSKDHSLDRIDPYGNYCPENCRWATSFVQNNNKCKHRILKYNGLEMTEKEWITFLYNETMKLQDG